MRPEFLGTGEVSNQTYFSLTGTEGTSWFLVVINLMRESASVPGASLGSVDFISVPPPQPKRQKMKTEEKDFFMFNCFLVNQE